MSGRLRKQRGVRTGGSRRIQPQGVRTRRLKHKECSRSSRVSPRGKARSTLTRPASVAQGCAENRTGVFTAGVVPVAEPVAPRRPTAPQPAPPCSLSLSLPAVFRKSSYEVQPSSGCCAQRGRRPAHVSASLPVLAPAASTPEDRSRPSGGSDPLCRSREGGEARERLLCKGGS